VAATAVLLGLGVGGQTPGPGEMVLTKRPYPPPAVFTSQSSDVTLAVVVRDRDGRVVSDLTRDDFAVSDNGRRETLTAFSVRRNAPPAHAVAPTAYTAAAAAGEDSAVPANVAVFVDDLHTGPNDLRAGIQAVEAYMASPAAAADAFAVATSSGKTTGSFLRDRTTLTSWLGQVGSGVHDYGAGCPYISPEQAFQIVDAVAGSDALQLAINQAAACGNCAAAPQRGRRGAAASGPGCPDPVALQQRAKMVWDQVESESRRTIDNLQSLMGVPPQQPGSRSLLLVSAGFPSHELETELDGVIASALRAGVVVNSLDARGLAAQPPNLSHGPDDPVVTANLNMSVNRDSLNRTEGEANLDALASVAQATGGHLFTNSNDLAGGTAALLSPEAVYDLAYAPGAVKSDGRFHALQVKLDRAGMNVQARRGFYDPKPDPAADPAVARRRRDLEEAVAATTAPPPSGTPLLMGAAADKTSRGIEVTVQINLAALPYARHGGRNLEHLTLISVIRDAHGRIISGEEGTISLQLTDATRNRLHSMRTELTLQAPSGPFELREVLQESEHGQISELRYPLVVP